MRTITEEFTVYKFDELSEEEQLTIIEKHHDINLDYEWWDGIYDEVERQGGKITSFDLDRSKGCKLNLLDIEEFAHNIIDEHGETCDTYKTSSNYLEERDRIIEAAPVDEHGEFECEFTLDGELDEADSDYVNSIKEDYASILQNQYEFLCSDEAIIETIKENDYEFTSNGDIY